MALIPFLSNTRAWTAGRLPAPWDTARPSILSFVEANMDQNTGRLHDPAIDLPDEQIAPGDDEIRFVAGGLEGAFGHHGNPSDEDSSAEEIVQALGTALKNPNKANIKTFYEAINSESVLDYIDALLEKVADDQAFDPERLWRLVTWIARHAPDRGPVKAAMAIAGLLNDGGKNRDLFFALGCHEEFTLFAAVALANTSEDPEDDLWRLAGMTDGWGRIQAVERLAETKNPDIKAWLVREGYRNNIMHEYLAHTCAQAGGLLDELRAEKPDTALLSGAGEIIDALIIGGPAEDMDDYEDGPEAVENYLKHMGERDIELDVFLVAMRIQNYVSNREQDWKAAKGKWTVARRREIGRLAAAITDRPRWRDDVSRGLKARGRQEFNRALEAARLLGIDTWDVMFDRQAADIKEHYWWDLMQTDDVARIRKVVALAEKELPLDQVATGPGDSMFGVGEDYWIHTALNFVAQDLRRFPGEGWALLRMILGSPVVVNRNMVLNALNDWPRDVWPGDARLVLEAAEQAECEADVKERITNLLAGENICS